MNKKITNINSRVVLITGATAGIGKATAYTLASRGFNLILTGRRENILLEVKEDIIKKYGVQVLPLCFDVTSLSEVKESINQIEKHFPAVDVLINNAGLALGLTPFDEGEIDDWITMLDTNVKGLLLMTKLTLPLLRKSETPLIINIGSVAGKETYPMGHVYCATKHAVDSLTKGMRIDLLKYNIKVTQLCPGAVETEFSEVRFKGDKQRAKNVYKGFKPLLPEDIAHVIDFIVALPPHVNINDILVMPTAQAAAGIIKKDV